MNLAQGICFLRNQHSVSAVTGSCTQIKLWCLLPINIWLLPSIHSLSLLVQHSGLQQGWVLIWLVQPTRYTVYGSKLCTVMVMQAFLTIFYFSFKICKVFAWFLFLIYKILRRWKHIQKVWTGTSEDISIIILLSKKLHNTCKTA